MSLRTRQHFVISMGRVFVRLGLISHLEPVLKVYVDVSVDPVLMVLYALFIVFCWLNGKLEGYKA